MNALSSCECSSEPTLIFACSGAADVGEVTDLVARRLDHEGVGKMSCLAGIGGRVSGIIEKTRSAERVLALDGCQLDCARLTLEEADFTGPRHVRMTDLGMEKGKAAGAFDGIANTAGKVNSLLNGRDAVRS